MVQPRKPVGVNLYLTDFEYHRWVPGFHLVKRIATESLEKKAGVTGKTTVPERQ